MVYFYVIFIVLGAIFGSFAGAQVWRLRARQLVEDKEYGEKVDNKELKRLSPLLVSKVSKDRSRCLSCGRELLWQDLLPIVSWISLGGKCRYCKKSIGWTECLLEITMAVLFVATIIFHAFPADVAGIAKLVLWLVGLVCLAIMFVYDSKWSLLPDAANVPFICSGAIYATISIFSSSDIFGALISLGVGILILSGLYLLLYIVSHGNWIGFGDVKLGLGMALFLLDWRLAFATLFLANLIGTIIVMPALLRKRINGQMKIPFGPLLITGFLIAWYSGSIFIQWCQSLLF